MDSKRRAVFSAHVLHKLFPPTKERNSDKVEVEITSSSQTQEIKGSSNSKVYSAYLPPEICEQLRAANNNSEKALSTSDEESTDLDEEEPIQKRRRKRRGKWRVHHQCTDAQGHHSLENSSLHQGELIESQDVVEVKKPSVDNTKPLTKNQKRKLRKKRRRNVLGDQVAERASEFTFEQDKDKYPNTNEKEKEKIDICGEVEDFMQAVWDIYSRDRKNDHNKQQAAFDALVLLLRHLNQETLISLQHLKELLVLQNATKAKEKIHELKDVVSDEHLAILNSLADYWLMDVMQVSMPPTQKLKGTD